MAIKMKVEKRYLSAAEAAKIIGIPDGTFKVWVQDRVIPSPAVQIGMGEGPRKRYGWDEWEIRRWVKDNMPLDRRLR